MTTLLAVRERREICSSCGSSERITVETDTETIDHCYRCGHERRISIAAVRLVGRAGQNVRVVEVSAGVSPAR